MLKTHLDIIDSQRFFAFSTWQQRVKRTNQPFSNVEISDIPWVLQRRPSNIVNYNHRHHYQSPATTVSSNNLLHSSSRQSVASAVTATSSGSIEWRVTWPSLMIARARTLSFTTSTSAAADSDVHIASLWLFAMICFTLWVLLSREVSKFAGEITCWMMVMSPHTLGHQPCQCNACYTVQLNQWLRLTTRHVTQCVCDNAGPSDMFLYSRVSLAASL